MTHTLKWRRAVGVAALGVSCLAVGRAGYAQQRPLVTEDPETVGAGRMLIEFGFDYLRAQKYPVSGLEGNLMRLPSIGASMGVGPAAEIQIDGVLHDSLSITARNDGPLAGALVVVGNTTTDFGDVTIGAKVRLLSEGPGRPSVATRFATRLPNASNESGLGTDTFDFYTTLLVGKTAESLRIIGNVGLGILSDPTNATRQNDVLLYGVSVARSVTDPPTISDASPSPSW